VLGIDLFCGAGGMSVGAEMSGVKVKFAVETDPYAAVTFRHNHPETTLIHKNIKDVEAKVCIKLDRDEPSVLFGGPPCQGFSTSNQKNRNTDNPNNWLFQEYFRIVQETTPDWVVFENVKGLIETESGYFLDEVLRGFKDKGYTTSSFILNSADYGVPQKRNRLFIIGSLHGINISPPQKNAGRPITVGEAFKDLPDLINGDTRDVAKYSSPAQSLYAESLRRDGLECWNNIVTNNAPYIIERYRHIPEGGNWENIPKKLMANYKDASRCHTGIYRRLKSDEPSVVIGNFRKNMLIHPWQDRGLSVREAARLQSFPDAFKFFGSIGFQQQQVGNAVPPLLAKTVFDLLKSAST
jgi:DNA (cytosine-5)-methyltransferase 1